MTAAILVGDCLQGPYVSCTPLDENLRAAAQTLLRTSSFGALRELHCDVAEAVVVVQGHVASYYLKQMAQTILLQHLDGMRGIRNLVQVRQPQLHQD